MKSRIIVLAGTLLLWASAVFGQAATPKTTTPPIPIGGGANGITTAQEELAKRDHPTLKPEIALKLREIQVQQLKAESEYQQMQARTAQLREQYNQRQNQYVLMLGTALKDSGIDEKKFVINPETLEVTVKPPEPPKPATAEKK